MKWLQLDCDFPEDPKIRLLAREWGAETAAAFWVLLLAFVGGHGGPGCRVKMDESGAYSAHYVATKLSSKRDVTLRRLGRAAMVGLIDREAWENHREIYIPNMLKRVDNYTRKVRTRSEETTDKVPKPPHVEVEEEREIEKERKLLRSRLDSGFEELWAQYPVKDSRKDAEKHFRATVTTDETLSEIRRALPNYQRHLAANDWKRPKSGKTWFNNWADWKNWIEPEKLVKDPGAIERPTLKPHVHHCEICNPIHFWKCSDPETCGAQVGLACPEAAARYAS